MLENLRRYLHSSNEPVKTVVIGSFLAYFGVFIVVPTLFVMGYFVRVVRGAALGESLPGFEAWRELLIDGTKAYLIWMVYLSIPLLNLLLLGEVGGFEGVEGYQGYELLITFVVILTGGGVFAIFVPFGGRATIEYLGGDDPQLHDAGAQLIEVPTVQQFAEGVAADPYTHLLLVVVWFVAPAALANFARKGTLRAGFEFRTIRKTVTTRRYVAGWLAFIVLYWGSLSAFLSWQLWAIDVEPPLEFLALALEDAGLYGMATELREGLVSLSAVVYFSLLVVAHATLGIAYRPLGESFDDGNRPSDADCERSDLDRRPSDDRTQPQPDDSKPPRV